MSFSLMDPHQVLGLHTMGKEKVVRLFRPGATTAYVEVRGRSILARKSAEWGLFEVEVPQETTRLDYCVYLHQGRKVADPYAFSPMFGEWDAYLFGRGVHYQLHEKMGARLCVHQGMAGVSFTVWAPHAKSVAVVGDFNAWDGRMHPMRLLGSSGVWELFVPGLEEGEKYKFELRTQEGVLLLKADPYALYTEQRPKNASIVWNENGYVWHDARWLEERKRYSVERSPFLVYEVHLPSWKMSGGCSLGYRQIAPELAAYCKKMGFTHVELLPIAEHPLDESWGYQVTGFFSATSRLGTPRDFQFFVDHLHQEGIGVIMDWVPAHFPLDAHALARFDGTHLYEHQDPRQGIHPHWNTGIFNYGRAEVSNFLLSSALFWVDKMHVDGLRMDAVASMLYLDYGRKEGEWIPNREGGRENLEAIEWIKHFNSILGARYPKVLRIAEESTAFPKVSHPLEEGGLGFTMKWNMGWMNDTLRYFRTDPLFRAHQSHLLTFGITYAFSERFVLPFSHDEVVHAKGSLLSKMPGDDWQKFAQLRLLYSYQMCQPGKKLIFMGAEIGQWEEWNCKLELPWFLLTFDRHAQVHRFFSEMNHLYLQHPALWEREGGYEGFEWVDFSDRDHALISYIRQSETEKLLIVHNFTPLTHKEYFLPLSGVVTLEEVFNTDREEYFGSGKLNKQPRVMEKGVELTIAPLATMIFKVHRVSCDV